MLNTPKMLAENKERKVMIRSLQDVSAFEKLCLIDISYSRLSTYTDCNLKYYYSYVLREDRVFGAAATMGNVIHAVMEDTPFTGVYDLDDMLARMDLAREGLDPDHEIPPTLTSAGEEMLTEFVDRHQGDIYDVVATELPFAMVVGPALISGYIDRVHKDPNGRIVVTDWKSGKYEVTNKAAPTDLQLGIYALAMSHTYPGVPIRAELYYLRSGRIKGHDFTVEDLAVVEDRVLDLVYEMIERNSYQATDDKQKCRFCDFAKNGVCATGARRFGWREPSYQFR